MIPITSVEINKPVRLCAHCNDVIQKHRRSNASYCSTDCQSKAHYQRFTAKYYDKILNERRVYRSTNAENFMIYRLRHKTKKAGIPFNITVEDLPIPTLCPILGIELKWNRGIGRIGYHPNSPSVDRIVPSLGYVKGNVRVISARANLLKNDASVGEIEAVLADLRAIEAGACK